MIHAWPYDSALAAMHAARDRVSAGGAQTIFVGSHQEEVVTLGRHTPESQLLARAALDARGVLVRRVERGGGATAHGPGQIVCYPVVHLPTCGLDVPGLTRALLESAREVAREHGVDATVELAGTSGLYVGGAKVASVGFRVERGVVTHGLALNVDNDVSLFDLIAPCGVRNQRITTLAREAHGSVRVDDVGHRLGFHVARRCMLAWAVTQLTGGAVGLVGTGAHA